MSSLITCNICHKNFHFLDIVAEFTEKRKYEPIVFKNEEEYYYLYGKALLSSQEINMEHLCCPYCGEIVIKISTYELNNNEITYKKIKDRKTGEEFSIPMKNVIHVEVEVPDRFSYLIQS